MKAKTFVNIIANTMLLVSFAAAFIVMLSAEIVKAKPPEAKITAVQQGLPQQVDDIDIIIQNAAREMNGE